MKEGEYIGKGSIQEAAGVARSAMASQSRSISLGWREWGNFTLVFRGRMDRIYLLTLDPISLVRCH